MVESNIDFDLIISIISISIALISVYLTYRQLKQSNKIALFEKRIQIWSVINELMGNFEVVKDLIKKDDSCYQLNLENLSKYLVYSQRLYDCKDGILDKNQEDKIVLLKKCFELKNNVHMINFLFCKKKYLKVQEFIVSYIDLMNVVREINWIINYESNKFPQKQKSLEEKQIEDKYRNKELLTQFEVVKTKYDEIQKSKLLERMQKEIKIKK